MGYVKSRKRNSGMRHTAMYVDQTGAHQSVGTYDSWREADRAWKVAEGRIADSRWIEISKSKITFADFVDQIYWPLYAGVREPSTRAGYHYMLAKNLRPKFGKVPLRAISAEMIQLFVAELSRTLSPSTVRKNVLLLSKILNVAIKTRRLQVNECAGVELPPMAKRVMTVATPEQFDRLLRAIPQEWQMLVELAIETGARWGELAELRVQDFDASRRRIVIARAVAENSTKVTGENTRYVVKDYPKSREHRIVRLSTQVAVRLDAHAKDLALAPEGLLFSASDGSHISRSNFRTRVWVPARKSADLDTISFHGLRHAHASWLLASGADLQEVKERLGHASIATTERYLHTVDAEDDHVVDAFAAFRHRTQVA